MRVLAFDGRRCGTPSCLRQVASLAYVATTCRVYPGLPMPGSAGGRERKGMIFVGSLDKNGLVNNLNPPTKNSR